MLSFYQRFLVIAAFACVIAVVALGRPADAAMSRRHGALTTACVAAVATALLAVGIVSHTLVRHVIQIAPLALALVLLVRASPYAAAAAAPLFGFWLLVMGAIWLFLFGVARIVTGRFTPTEIGLTVVIGIASGVGLAAARRDGTSLILPSRVATVALFGILQYAALYLSTQPFAR